VHLEPTGLIVQRDDSVFVDFSHVVDDVLWIHIAPIQHLVQRIDPQNLLEADTHTHTHTHTLLLVPFLSEKCTFRLASLCRLFMSRYN